MPFKNKKAAPNRQQPKAQKSIAQIKADAQILADAMGVEVPDMEALKELAALGFEKSESSYIPRIVVCSAAAEKEGKTHLAIHTTPPPVGILDLDCGLEGVIDKRPDGRAPYITKTFPRRRECRLSGKPYTQDDAKDDRDDVIDAYRALVRTGLCRTIVIDTATELWEVVRIAEFGKLTQVKHLYPPVNAFMTDLLQLPHSRKGLNAVFVHKLRKEYKKDNWTGGWELKGFGDTPYIAQCNIRHFKTKGDEDSPAEFGIRIVNCRQNHESDGEELVGKTCNFTSLARTVFPDTKKEYWA